MMMHDLTHTRLPETGTPPALSAARLNSLIDHTLTYAQSPVSPTSSAKIIAFKRHVWTTGFATAGLAAAIMLAVLPGTFSHLTTHSTIATGGFGQTAQASSQDDFSDVDDMLTLNTLDSFGATDPADAAND